jgi:SSS family solute:Na+ symporter
MDFTILAVTILAYVLVTGYMGWLGWKHTKNAEDYLVAGRNQHPVVMALSYGATFISTAAIVGFGGIAAVYGMGLLWLPFFNILVGIFIAFAFVGKRTRRIGLNLNAHTIPELMGKRYNSPLLQRIGGGIIFVCMPIYASVVLIGGARFLETALKLDFIAALLIFTLVTALYVIAGGLKGVMYSDALQGGVMVLGMIIMLAFTYIRLGGIVEAHQHLTNLAPLVPESLKAKGHLGWTAMPAFNSAWWWILLSSLVLGVGIGVLAQPQLAIRFMTVKSDRDISRGIVVGAIFILCTAGFAYVVGALSNVFFMETQGKISIAAANGNADNIIPLFITSAMPSWFGYIFMLTLLSAAMSTLSSQFHVMGTSLGRDIFIRSGSDNYTLRLTRAGVVIGIILSVIVGYLLPGSVVARGTALFFGISAATFIPAYIGGLYWKGVTRKGAVASVITGFTVSLFALLFMHQQEAIAVGLCNAIFGRNTIITSFPWPFVDPLLIALPLSVIALVVVSVFTEKLPNSHVKNIFFGVK